MSYKPFEITERIKELKQIYKTLPVPSEEHAYNPVGYKPFGTGDRWITLGYLRGFFNHADAETTRLRSSYAEAEELYESEPQICGSELLLGHLYLPKYTEGEQAEYDKLCEMFQMSSHTLLMRSPRKDHLSLDLEKLIRLGLDGIKSEINAKIEALNLSNASIYPEYENAKKYEFYKCLQIELDALSDLAARYSKTAFEMAQKSDEPRKAELLRLSEIMKRVPAKPAATFYEALQSIQFFLSALFGLYPLGRPDRYLYTLYERDIKSGALTREFAQELIDNFCLCVSDRVFSRAACGFIVGGRDGHGCIVENELTYMFLTALDHLKLPDPNGALAVNAETSTELLEYACEILSHGTSHPAFYNDGQIISSLVDNYGVAPADAVNYIHTTCAEISVIGKSRSHTTAITIDMPRLLLEAVRKNPDAADAHVLTEKLLSEIKALLATKASKYAMRMLEVSRIGNEAMRVCALVDDCIERGKSIYEGGERYTFIQPIFVGFATVADSLTAIETLVFREKKLTLKEFRGIVDNNFKGNEKLRQYIINKIPHYGNDNDLSDKSAAALAAGLLGIFKSGDIPLGAHMMPGTFTYINHAELGRDMGATFDGRVRGYSYSDGCSAVQGRDTNGPTAMLLSLTSWEQSVLLGGMVVNIKLGSTSLDGGGKKNFISLLRGFMSRGGIEIQVNVVSRAELEDARLHPENHSDLLVRIGGYSDYFVRLTPTLQQEIIDRTEY